MRALLSNMKIGHRIPLGVALPVLCMIGFGAILFSERMASYRELVRVADLAGLSPKISEVVHELQRERGESAAFISSKGTSFAAELPKQRAATDARIAELRASVAGFDFDAFDAGLKSQVAAALDGLQGLAGMRGGVDGQAVTVPDMAKYYTGSISTLLGLVDEALRLTRNEQVLRRISAYINVLQAKEKMGQERAMGASGFGAGAFNAATYNRFVGLIAAEDALLAAFDRFATPEARRFYGETVR